METVFLKILNMSVAGGYCIVFVMLIRLLLKKAPRIYAYALWAVVLLRLLFPFFPESRLGLVPLGEDAVSGNRAYSQELVNSTEVYYGMQNQPESLDGRPAAGIAQEPDLAESREEGPRITYQNVKLIRTSRLWVKVGGGIWLAGMILLFTYAAGAALALRLKLRTARLLSDGIYESDRIKTPFLFGLLKPAIYLPVGVEEAEALFILKHETVHLKRLDYLIKPLAFITAGIHWFNPLVWIAFRLMSRDMEMSCDESVIRQLGEGAKKAYSEALLNLSVNRRPVMAGPLAFGEDEAKARIKNVLSYRKPAIGTAVAALAVVAVVTLGLLGNRSAVRPGAEGQEAAGGASSGIPEGNGTAAEEASAGAVGDAGEGKDGGTGAVSATDTNNGTEAVYLPDSGLRSDPVAYNAALREPYRGTELTLGLLSGSLAVLTDPALADYCGFTNAQWTALEERPSDSLTDYVTYSLTDARSGETYELQVYYYIEDNSLQTVLLLRNSDAASLLLYDEDPRRKEYTDRDVEAFLAYKEAMSDFLSYELPANLEKGAYSASLAEGSGELFYWTGKELQPDSAGEGMPAEWDAAGGVICFRTGEEGALTFEDGRLTALPVLWNHSWPIGDPEPLEGCAAVALLAEVEHDRFTASELAEAEQSGSPIPEEEQTSRMWYVFFAKEDSRQVYYIFLNRLYFTREDCIALARSVRFTDQAFR